MRVTIYQPQYFPRLHYFNRILDADDFVILDSAQYIKVLIHHENGKKKHKSYQSDTPIKLPHGKQFLTVPVKRHGFLSINGTPVDYTHDWVSKHLRTLQMAYGKAPFFKKHYLDIEKILKENVSNLAELNIKTILWGVSNILGFKLQLEELTLERVNQQLAKTSKVRLKNIVRDSDTGLQKLGNSKKPNEWIVSICKLIGANQLLHGETSKAGYMDLEFFESRGITSVVQDWNCQEYSQEFSYRVEFLPNLSILDLVFNTDQRSALKLLYK